jgi:hypothetical protein
MPTHVHTFDIDPVYQIYVLYVLDIANTANMLRMQSRDAPRSYAAPTHQHSIPYLLSVPFPVVTFSPILTNTSVTDTNTDGNERTEVKTHLASKS